MDASVIAEWPLEDGDAVFVSEEMKRKAEDDIGAREEKVEGPSQVLPPSCPSVFSGDDLEYDGESEGAEESVFSGDDSEDDGESEGAEESLFSGDDSEAEEEPPLDPKVKEKYSQQIRESEGFDIFDFPGRSFRTPIVPLVRVEESPAYESIVDLARWAIGKYNIVHNEEYEFFHLARVNKDVGRPVYYITFQVKNLKAATFQVKDLKAGICQVNPKAAIGNIETFQAKVRNIVGKTDVMLIRPKPIKPQN